MMNKSVKGQIEAATPGLNLIEIKAYLPSNSLEVRAVPADKIREWNPMLGLSYEDEEGKVRSLIGWSYEMVFEQSRIARL